MTFQCVQCGGRTGYGQPGDVAELSRLHWINPICSDFCLQRELERRSKMIDPTPYEEAAMEHAGEQAGEFLESLRKINPAAVEGISKLTAEEWQNLIFCTCSGYVAYLVDAQGKVNEAVRKAVGPI
jgi:hypothetical protein